MTKLSKNGVDVYIRKVYLKQCDTYNTKIEAVRPVIYSRTFFYGNFKLIMDIFH